MDDRIFGDDHATQAMFDAVRDTQTSRTLETAALITHMVALLARKGLIEPEEVEEALAHAEAHFRDAAATCGIEARPDLIGGIRTALFGAGEGTDGKGETQPG